MLILTQGQHNTMALINQVYDIGRVIERLREANSSLRQEVKEVKSGPNPEAVAMAEQRTSDFEDDVNCLRTKLKETRAHIRMLNNELLTLSRDVEATMSTS